MTKSDPFKYFHSSLEIIRLAVMMYVRFPLSLQNVEDLLHERGIDISHKTVRFWWNRFGPLFAAGIEKLRSYGAAMKVFGNAWKQETGRWLNNRAQNSHPLPDRGLFANHAKGPFRRRERAMLRFRCMRSL